MKQTDLFAVDNMTRYESAPMSGTWFLLVEEQAALLNYSRTHLFLNLEQI